jgi:hypothetical chaperone protein
MNACGLDFGTSNSAIEVIREGRPTLASVERDATLIPSAVFFDYETRGRILFGAEAIAAYMGHVEGRLMRALKSILGSPLVNESTALGGRKVALADVVELFIRHLKAKAEDHVGAEIDAVAHGRPVRFVDGDDKADAKAQGVLEEIAKRVGFRNVEFVYEPIAAAYHYEQSATREEIVLVADIGGGTSDFTGGQDRTRAAHPVGSHQRYPRQCRCACWRHGLRYAFEPRRRHACAWVGHALGQQGSSDAQGTLLRAGNLGDDQLHLHVPERTRGSRARRRLA